MRKLAVLTSHPIQYQAPLFQRLAKDPKIDLMVYFCWDFGVDKESFDPEFGKKLKWDIPLLDGYNYKFLKNYSLKPDNKFFGLVNFGIVKELKTNKYDLLFVHGWNSLTNILAVFTAFSFGIPVAMHGDNCFACESVKPQWKRKLKKIILTNFFRKIRFFLYMGVEDKKFYQYHNVSENKLIFMPYATDNDGFFKLAKTIDREKIRRKESVDKNVVILFAGKFVPRKRPMDLLRAYEILTRNIRISPNITNKVRIIEKELSYKLNGIFFEIHNELGRFARERQYADALEIKLKKNGIKYRREFAADVAGRKSNIADFIISDKILIEFKRKPVNNGDDYKQVMRYLEAFNLELGLLVNFGLEYLKPRRVLNPKFKNDSVDSLNSDTFVNSGYNINLVFVGDGALRSELEDHIRKHNIRNVHFAGFKNLTEMPEYYAMADIFVIPSFNECWGIVVNEAMCFGLPVIASDTVGSIPDLVINGENGFIYKTGDIDELAEKLNVLAKNKTKRHNFGKKSLEIVKNYSYENDIRGILRAFEILAKP